MNQISEKFSFQSLDFVNNVDKGKKYLKSLVNNSNNLYCVL